MSGIYAILNLITEVYYIGSAKSIYHRWHIHKAMLNGNYHDNSYLQRAWNKYGQINFILVILENCEQSELINREQYWIDILCADKTLSYNLRKNATSNIGIKFSEQAKINISKGKKGTIVTEETKIKLRLAQRNRPPISEATRTKLRLSKLNQSEETRRKNSESNKGRIFSEETKLKMKMAWKLRKIKNGQITLIPLLLYSYILHANQ